MGIWMLLQSAPKTLSVINLLGTKTNWVSTMILCMWDLSLLVIAFEAILKMTLLRLMDRKWVIRYGALHLGISAIWV